MELLQKIFFAILALSLVTFIALFGSLPALRRTPIGFAQRLLCIHIPGGLKRIDGGLTGGLITTRSKRLGNYLFYEKNPIVLILFLGLLTGSAFLFLWNTLHRLPTSLIIPIPLVLGAPYVFTYLSVTQNAHYITPRNHQAHLRDYPFDYVLYRPDNICRTCNLEKPARSKHCSLCGVCVAKSDHHCPWINNCVGQSNYGYFMGVLFSLGFVNIYGAYLSYYILRPAMNKALEGQEIYGFWTRFLTALIVGVDAGGLSVAGVGMLAAATASLPLALGGYHCYLIWAGMTTNESQKWSEWRDDIADGCVFRASREALTTHLQAGFSDDANGGRKVNSAIGFIREGGELHTGWPVSSDQIIVQTSDGNPPIGQETLWRRIWSLNDVENIYDLGGWDNFMDVVRGR